MATSKRDIEISLKALRNEAVEAGFMEPDEALIYEAGSRTNGIAPAIYVGRKGAICHWIPRFTPKSTPREVERVLDASTWTLRAVRIKALEDQQ